MIFRNRTKCNKMMVRYIKRLAFVVQACQKDQFSFDNRYMTTTILDGLALMDPHVHQNCLLMVRVMLLNMSRPTMIPIWPVILAELLRILTEASPGKPERRFSLSHRTQKSRKKIEQGELDLEDQPMIPLSALKVADTANLLQLDEFQLHNYIFMPDMPDIKGVVEEKNP